MRERDNRPHYPLLEGILAEKGLSLKGTYTTRDVAEIFGSSVGAIQRRIRSGQWKARDLPGRARFISQDLEDILQRIPNGSDEDSPAEEDDE